MDNLSYMEVLDRLGLYPLSGCKEDHPLVEQAGSKDHNLKIKDKIIRPMYKIIFLRGPQVLKGSSSKQHDGGKIIANFSDLDKLLRQEMKDRERDEGINVELCIHRQT